MPTAATYNQQEEAKKLAKAKEEEGKEKKPVMTRDGKRYICANKGCTAKNFIEEENGPNMC